MTIVMRPSCWHKNFGANGLPAPAQGLCLNFFPSVTTDFSISSALRWAIQDKWSSGNHGVMSRKYKIHLFYLKEEITNKYSSKFHLRVKAFDKLKRLFRLLLTSENWHIITQWSFVFPSSYAIISIFSYFCLGTNMFSCPLAQSDAHPTGIQEAVGSILLVANFLSWKLVMKLFLQLCILDSSFLYWPLLCGT